MRKGIFENYVKDFLKDLSSKETHNCHRCKHSAVLTYNNVIISSGTNVNLKNDFTKTYDDLKTLHAESVVIMRAMKRHSKIISKCDLWVSRNNDNATFSKPCSMCQKIIRSFGIRKVHYTNEKGEWVNVNY